MKLTYLQLIERVNRQDVDFNEVADIIVRDVSLSYKLLKLVNSTAFGLRNKVKTVRQALIVLGTKELKKMVSLMALHGLIDDKPDEIVRTSLVRGKFGELLADETPLSTRKEECFLMGLFSTLDVLMDRPMKEVLSGISLSEDVRLALLEKKGLFGRLLQLMLSYERGDWMLCSSYASSLRLNENKIAGAYIEALRWSRVIE